MRGTGPTLAGTPTTRTGFNYLAGSGPSASQSFSLSGSNLTAGGGNITITGSTDYDVSTDNTNFANTAILPYTGTGTFASSTVYVRLKAGLAAANYNGEAITAAGGGAASTTVVTVSGSVTAPTPTITVAPATAQDFGTTPTTIPSVEQSYAVSATALTANLTVVAPAGYEISLTSGTYTGTGGNTLTLTQSGGTVASTTIYVRLTGTTAGTYGTSTTPVNITHASTGATTVNKPVYGAVVTPAITTGTITQTAYCATSATTITVPFSTTGTFGAGNVFSVQLSTAAGSFTGATTLATVSSTATSVTATIPAGTTNSTNYYVRIVSSSPAINSGTVRNITIVGNQTLTVAPATDQTISVNGGNGATLTATETPSGAATRQWYYSTTSGSGYTNAISGATGTTYIPTAASLGGAVGTYYVVVQSTFTTCGTTLTSNEVKVTVVNSRLVVNPTSLSGFITPAGTASAFQTYTLQGFDLVSSVTVLPITGFEAAYTVGLTPGTPGTYSTTSLTISQADALAGVTVYVRLRSGAAAGSYSGNIAHTSTGATIVNVGVSGTVTTLTVSANSLTAFSTSVGTPSVARSFTVSGSNLTNDVAVTVPVGYEVALTSATGPYASTQTIVPSSGTVNAVFVYVRLTGATAGSYSGNVNVTSPNATSRTVAVTGTVLPIAAEPTVQPTIAVSNVGFTQADITLSGGDGQKRLVVLRTPSASGFTAPADNTTYPASLALGSSTLQGTGNYVMVADGTTTTATLTNLTPNQSYTLSVYAYNDDNVATQENYLITAPGTASFATIATPTTYYAKATGDLSQLSTFGFNTDGSGQSPSNFTATSKAYSVSGTGRTITANWTVSGTGSKVVLAANSSLIIPVGAVYTGSLDQQANSTLTLVNPTTAAYSSITQTAVQDATSTIEFAQTSATYTVPSTLTYKNLKLTANTKYFAIGTTSVPGNLTLENVTNAGGTSTASFSVIALRGNLSLLGTTTFDATSARRVTLNLISNTTQTISGNGNTLRLFRLRTTLASGSVVLSDGAGAGTTPVEVGNANGGGVELIQNTTLVLNSNTLSFTPGGTAAFNTDANSYGTVTGSSTSSLNLENTNGNIGYLVLTPNAAILQDLRIVTNSGDALILYSSNLTVTGTLTLPSSTSCLDITSFTLTLNGTVAGSGSVAGSSSAGVVIGGTGPLGTLRFLSGYQTVQNLTLNRAGTATLGSPLTVGGTLTFTNGTLTTTATNLLSLAGTNASALSGGSATSFVNGPLARATAVGGFNITFPIGSGTAYRPLTLATTTNQVAASIYTAEQREGDPGQPASGNTLLRVSKARSFSVTSSNTTAGNFTGTISLSYGSDDGVNTPSDLGFTIAKRDLPADWTNIGAGTATGTGTGAGGASVSGMITSAPFSNFSEFALASTTPNNLGSPQVNPLPVSLTRFTAARSGSSVALNWATASETNSAYFEVQRSLDGVSFGKVATVAAAGISLAPLSYASLDLNAPAAALYYRLRLVDLDGTATYSAVVAVAGEATELTLSPNPTHSSVHLTTALALPYVVRSTLGQVVLSGTTQAGTATTVEVQSLAAGVYLFELQGLTGRVVQKLVKE